MGRATDSGRERVTGGSVGAAGASEAALGPSGGDTSSAAPADGAIAELGVDIIRVDRIHAALERHGERFARRVLTAAEAAYVRSNAERFAGRWAAKEAVSKVLGLGVRGVGWRDIEVVRLPTGQPAVRLSGRAHARAHQLGMGRIALSITHEREYAVAVASGVRTAGGAFLFPPDIEERLDEREQRLVARLERIRALGREVVEAREASGTESEPAEVDG